MTIQAPASLLLMTVMIVTGALLNGVQTTMYALAAHAYPTEIRGTGVGVAVAFGRIGNVLAAPKQPLAEAIADEWRVQQDVINPAVMPLTRLANTVIDAVAPARNDVAAEVEKYLGTDLVCYRADRPDGLVARQSMHWDPVVAWARDALGARFVLTTGIIHVAQPQEAIAAAMMLANAATLPLMTGAAWLMIHAATQPKLMQTVLPRVVAVHLMLIEVMAEVLRQAETVAEDDPQTAAAILALLPDALRAMADQLQEK
jgi:hypothetical protein